MIKSVRLSPFNIQVNIHVFFFGTVAPIYQKLIKEDVTSFLLKFSHKFEISSSYMLDKRDLVILHF
jgi:hypothetical protein